MADGIPTYVVKNDKTGKKQVLHHAGLLLWFADYDRLAVIAPAQAQVHVRVFKSDNGQCSLVGTYGGTLKWNRAQDP